MFRKLIIILLPVVLMSVMTVRVSAEIEYNYFDNDTGDNDWFTPYNWTIDFTPCYQNPESDVYLGIDGLGSIVEVNSSGAEFYQLTIGFNQASQVDVGSDGYLGIAGSTIYLGGGPYGTTDAYGVINVNGGTVHAETWHIAAAASAINPGESASGTGIVNITNGGQMILGWWGSCLGTEGTAEINIINGTVTYWGGGLTIGTGMHIDIRDSSSLNLNGDLTSQFAPLIADGRITGNGVAGNVAMSYSSSTGFTNITSLGAVAMTLGRGITIDRQYHTIPPTPPYQVVRPSDVRLIKKLGFDFVKLLFNPALLMNSSDGSINTSNIWYVDKLVNMVRDEDLPVLLCIHPEDSFKSQYLASEGEFAKLLNFYQQFAAYLVARWDISELAFELMTEPHHNYLSWNTMLPQMWQAVRSSMPDHILVLDSDNYASIDTLIQLDPVADANVYYSFTTYEPFIFVLQGYYWYGDYNIALQRVPYPSSPAIVAAEKDRILDYIDAQGYGEYRSQAEADLIAYGNDTWNKSKQLSVLTPLETWNNAHGGNLKFICSEFGVYDADEAQGITGLDVGIVPEDRLQFIKDRRQALEESGISWCYWSFNESFTVLDPIPRRPVAWNPPTSWIHNPTLDALGLPECGCGCATEPDSPYDLNKDCYVNILDFAQFAEKWQECSL